MLEEMQTESSRGGIAVRNVNNRIKLLFGEEYGISIYSQSGAGTDVEITLPPNYDGGSYASERWAAAMQKNRKIFTLNRSGFEEETGYETGNTAL